MEKIKVINRHHFGLGFNVLCLATAGAMTVEVVKGLCSLGKKLQMRKDINEAKEMLEAMNKIMEFLDEDEAKKEERGEEEAQ